MKKMILSVVLLSTISVYGQKRVAVYPTTGTADSGIKNELAEALTTGLLNSGKYTLVDREKISQIQKEQELQQSGNVDDGQLVELGRLAGAEYICVSSVNKIGSNYSINYRLLDIGTGTIVDNGKKSANESTILDVINSISEEKLFTKNTGNSVTVNGIEVQMKDTGETGSKSEAKKMCPPGWRLPTLSELKVLCEKKEEIGGFNYGEYWSSATRNIYGVGIRFNSCFETTITERASVRCVRQ